MGGLRPRKKRAVFVAIILATLLTAYFVLTPNDRLYNLRRISVEGGYGYEERNPGGCYKVQYFSFQCPYSTVRNVVKTLGKVVSDNEFGTSFRLADGEEAELMRTPNDSDKTCQLTIRRPLPGPIGKFQQYVWFLLHI